MAPNGSTNVPEGFKMGSEVFVGVLKRSRKGPEGFKYAKGPKDFKRASEDFIGCKRSQKSPKGPKWSQRFL